MGNALLGDYVIVTIVGICLCLGYVIKTSLNFIPNKYIPLIMLVVGTTANVFMHIHDVTLQVVLSGMVSGLASTGGYEVAHYFVDEESIYQVVDDSDVAWHCGGKKYFHNKCRNSNSIGIEICLSSKETISEKTIQNTAWLVQKLMKQYNIPESNVLRHYDITHKLCPAPFIDESKWETLKKQLVGNIANEKAYIRIISLGTDGKGVAVRKKPDWNAEPVVYV